MSIRQKTIFLLSITLVVLIVDQLVKVWIKTDFEPYQTQTLVSGFIELHFIENRGMAFGTELGSGLWAKYALTAFRLVVIIGIGFYLVKVVKNKTTNLIFLLSMALVFAGATGNLIDGLFYDYFFDLDDRFRTNWKLSYNENNDIFFQDHLRDTGFMLGSVVDMFRFTTRWPSWMPLNLGGQEIFPAIWNVADFSISCGIGLLLLKYKKFFGKKNEKATSEQTPV